MKLSGCAALALFLTTIYAHGVPVTLRVVDAAGKPIAGAQIIYFDYRDIPAPDSLVVAPDNARKTTRTTADGNIGFDLQGQPRNGRTVDGGQFVLVEPRLGEARVSAPGYGFRSARLLSGANEITLNAPARLNGVVRDEIGAPISGATVTLLGVEGNEDFNSDDRWLAPKLGLISAITQSDGHWQMEGLPSGYAYIVARAPDREAHHGQFWMASGENQAPPLALAPAGAIIGRILDRDGKPLKGVSVNRTDIDNLLSDAAGKFRVSNVPLGETALEFSSSNADWLGVDEEVKAIIPAQGAVVDVGDIKMGEGLLLSGMIRDQNGAALPNLELRVDEKTFRTDAKGHFETRVYRPFYYLEIVRDYRKIKDMPDIPNDATQFDLGDIIVERSVNLPLDVRDEDGNAVPQTKLRFTATDDAHLQTKPMFGDGGREAGSLSSPLQRETTIDGEGVFVPSVPAADYKIEGFGLWGVVESATATITSPAVGETPAPLKVVVRRFAPTRASGRVVDAGGAPLENVRVQITPKNGSRSVSAFSDKTGNWNVLLPDATTEPEFDKAELSPFTFVRGGAMTRVGTPQENAWKATDIVMSRTDIALVGRVVDAKGIAVAGARVGWNNNAKFDFSATDANGDFAVKGLPDVPAAIYASSSDGTRFVAATATPSTVVTLKLPPATAPLSDAESEKLWDELDIKRVSDLDRYFEALGNRRVFAVARRLDAKTNLMQIGEGLDDYLRERERTARTPKEREAVAREGIELLQRFDMGAFSSGMAQIAVTAARTDDAELRDWAGRWYDAQKPNIRPLDSPDKVEWYHVARSERVLQVGAALGRDDAVKYRDIWLAQIDREHNEYVKQFLPDWGETLWRADPKWFDEIVAKWPAPQQMAAIGGALKVAENPAQATALLARLDKLAKDPAVVAADAATGNSMSPISDSAEKLFQGQTNFARSMALVDAPAALDALDKVQAVIQSSDVYEIAAIIARQAIADGHADIARRALKIGLSDNYAGGSGAPALALIARGFDADLAAQLMEVARKNATTNFSMFETPGWSDVAAYAVALREFDAGAGRLMLEDQWAKRQQKPDKPDPDRDYEKQKLIKDQEKLAWAMAFYDVPRALQWLGEIKDNRDQWNNGIERTHLAIVVAALTPPERRSLLLGATYFN